MSISASDASVELLIEQSKAYADIENSRLLLIAFTDKRNVINEKMQVRKIHNDLLLRDLFLDYAGPARKGIISRARSRSTLLIFLSSSVPI